MVPLTSCISVCIIFRQLKAMVQMYVSQFVFLSLSPCGGWLLFFFSSSCKNIWSYSKIARGKEVIFYSVSFLAHMFVLPPHPLSSKL